MIKIKEMSDILIASNDLYKECGELFKYLADVRINFSSLKAHNVPWQLSQIIEIISASKMDKINLKLNDVIKNYCFNISENSSSKKAVISSFKAIFLISKLRNNKEKENMDFNDVLSIIEIYRKTYKLNSININNFSKENINALILLLNGKFSNNPLYFFPIFLILIEKLIENFPFKNSIKSTLINLYLIKNKLLFAPSMCFSYPLQNFYRKYKELLINTIKDSKKIKDFARYTFDLLKQASVVSRAFISDISKIKDKIERLEIAKNKKTNLFILKSIIFENFSDSKNINNQKEEEKKITEFLLENNLISEIFKFNNNKIYMFNEYLESINKLMNNKKEKTTKIFTLKENLN